ncbi:MAG: ABC transporter permease [Reichenbachiella sp.]
MKTPIKFLRWFCHPDLVEDVEGDLLELYDLFNIKKPKTAKWLLWLEVLKLFRPGIIRSISGSYKMNHFGMFKNYFKMTLRNAKKEKAFTILNVFCLTVGFTVCLYVGLYTIKEVGYDKFHEKGERIYRINQTYIWGESDHLFGSTGPAVMGAVYNEIPEFETMCRIHPLEDGPLVHAVTESDITIFEEKKIRAVDSTFFDMFTFEMIKGNSATALNNPYSIVLTEDMASKYFNSLDVLGKQMMIMENGEANTFQITGVTSNNPVNSHITFDMLISMNSIKRLERSNDSWWWTTFVTFGLLRPDADPASVSEKVAQVPGKYLEPFLMKYRGITYKEFKETGESWDLFIQPLLDIHLHSQHVYSRLNKIGDIKTVNILISITGLILLLSVINFVNLTTAKSSKRSKEVGVRKVLGSSRQSLMWQFMFESVLFCLTALIFSYGFLWFFLDQFNAVSGKEISMDSIASLFLILATIGVTLIVGVLAGAYPSFYLSSFGPIKALKSQVFQGAKASMVRNTLVTIQFTISIALIVCALVVRNQVQYWLEMDLGFNRKDIIIVENVERLGSSMETFKNELLNLATVKNVSLGSDTPPYMWDGDDNFIIKGADVQRHKANYWMSDEQFAQTFDLKFLAGRDFDKKKDHSASVIVTRGLVNKNEYLDLNEVIGKTLDYSGFEARIIGVIENFNAEFGLEQPPMAYYNQQVSFNHRKHREIAIRYKQGLTNDELIQLKYDIDRLWQEIKPGMPVVSHFLDEGFQQEFKPTMDFERMIEFFSVLAMIIAGLGLTGLVAYVIERKTKEIGIRKVLGASVSSILVLLSSEFGKLLLLGFLIASGLSWYLMSLWVQDFEYQAPIPWYVFIAAGFSMFIVAAFTIGFQTVKSARSNPVHSLKDE